MAAPATDPLRPDPLDLLADLLRYPRPGHEAAILACRDAVAEAYPRAGEGIARFARAVDGLRLEELQELYTRSFDLDPVAALEVGWHLYGESYDRGRFLVRMRELLDEVGVEETTELPDHLISVLPVLARLEPESGAELARSSALPAVARMLDGLAGNENPYEDVLRAVADVLEDRFPPSRGTRPTSALRPDPVPHHRRRKP